MSLVWLLVIVLLILAIAGLPQSPLWSTTYGWGYGPSSALGAVLIILLVLLLLGRI